MIQQMSAICSLVHLPFKNPAWTSSLNIWKFLIHVLLNLSLENFEHYFASVWDECNCAVVWTLFGIAFPWDWNENWPVPVFHCWVFQICWHIECSTLLASSFRILNSSAGIPSPPLALFIVMLSKAHLTSHSRMSGLYNLQTFFWFTGEYITPLLTLARGYSFCPLLMPVSEAFSISFIL